MGGELEPAPHLVDEQQRRGLPDSRFHRFQADDLRVELVQNLLDVGFAQLRAEVDLRIGRSRGIRSAGLDCLRSGRTLTVAHRIPSACVAGGRTVIGHPCAFPGMASWFSFRQPRKRTSIGSSAGRLRLNTARRAGDPSHRHGGGTAAYALRRRSVQAGSPAPPTGGSR